MNKSNEIKIDDDNLWKWGGGFPDPIISNDKGLSIYKKDEKISQIKASTNKFGYKSCM